MKVAFITGAGGQDASYLIEFLLTKNYIIHGLVRRNSVLDFPRLRDVRKNSNLHLHYGDLTDTSSINRILRIIKTKHQQFQLEVYHLAAQSHVGISFECPEYTTQAITMGILNILECIKNQNMIEYTKIYNASTSEMFGNQPAPQNENTQFDPKSPYACAKVFAHNLCEIYRDSYNMFVCSGLLFNHSSVRRTSNFILRKIAIGVAKYKTLDKILTLGNLNAKRDIGTSRDYVEGMYLMLQQETPQDFVLATETQYTIREFVEMAFEVIGKTITWKGSGLDEIGYDQEGNVIVEVNECFYRPNEVNNLLGDASKARQYLGWKPKTSTKDLLREMVEHELNQSHITSV